MLVYDIGNKTKMSEQITPAQQGPSASNLVPQVSPHETADMGYLAGLPRCGAGDRIVIGPDASLYPMEDLGRQTKSPDGTTFQVVLEGAIPTNLGEDGQVNDANNFAVISAKRPSDGSVAYAIIGLEPREDGGMRIIPGAEGHWLKPTSPLAKIGRLSTDEYIDPAKIWGEGGHHGPATSRSHVGFSFDTEGMLTVDVLGGNGMWAKTGQQLLRDAEAQQGHASLELHEAISPDPAHRFEAVENDPVFRALSEPFKMRLKEIEDAHKAHIADADAALSRAATLGPAKYDEANRARSAAYSALAEAQQPTRQAYRDAVLPYLAARRELFRDDSAAGYDQPGEAHFDAGRQGVVSRLGKEISWKMNTTHQGNNVYGSRNPKLGQIVPPTGATWRGVPGGLAYVNGEQVSTNELALRLAADMVAGTGGSYDLPVTYYRDTGAEAGLKGNLSGRMPVYRIREGVEYVIASRLVYGNDSALIGAQEIDPQTYAWR